MAINEKALEVLNNAMRTRTPVFFSGDGTDITFETRMKKIDSERVILENSVRPEFISRVAQSKRFMIQVQMIRFQADRIDSDGQHIVFPLKAMSVIEETRQSERFPFTAEERVICELLNPFDAETRIFKNVMDMSATGLSLRTRFESRLFSPGTTIPEIKVLIDGKLYSAVTGTIIYNRKLMTHRGRLRLQIGIKFDEKGGEPAIK